MARRVVSMLIWGFVLALASPASARRIRVRPCPAVAQTPKQQLADADVVVWGIATGPTRTSTLKVVKVYRGDVGETLSVVVPTGRCADSFQMVAGSGYLIYGKSAEKEAQDVVREVTVHRRTGSVPLAFAPSSAAPPHELPREELLSKLQEPIFEELRLATTACSPASAGKLTGTFTIYGGGDAEAQDFVEVTQEGPQRTLFSGCVNDRLKRRRGWPASDAIALNASFELDLPLGEPPRLAFENCKTCSSLSSALLRKTEGWSYPSSPEEQRGALEQAEEEGQQLRAIGLRCDVEGVDAALQAVQDFDVFDLQNPPPPNPKKLLWLRDPPSESARVYRALLGCALRADNLARATQFAANVARFVPGSGPEDIMLDWLGWITSLQSDALPLPAESPFFERAASRPATWQFLRDSEIWKQHPATIDLAAKVLLARAGLSDTDRETAARLYFVAEQFAPEVGYKQLSRESALNGKLDAVWTRQNKRRAKGVRSRKGVRARVRERRAARHAEDAAARSAAADAGRAVPAAPASPEPQPPAEEGSDLPIVPILVLVLASIVAVVVIKLPSND